MAENRNESGGTKEQGYAGAPEVVRRGSPPPKQQVSIVLPIVAAVAVCVVIVGISFALRTKAAKWRTYTSTPGGMATYRVSVDLPPHWQITEQGGVSQWGVRIVSAGPEQKTSPGGTAAMLATGLQITCDPIPQGQSFDQYMEVLARSRSMGLIDVKEIDVGGLPGKLVTSRQIQYQQAVYVAPEGKGTLYVLKLGCKPDEREMMQPIFDQVIKSFRVKR